MEGENISKPHMVLVPLTVQGHMIPMADLGLLLAARGATVSLITTPVNALRLSAIAVAASASALSLRLVELPLTPADLALPDGFECADQASAFPHLSRLFFDSLSSLADPLILYLRRHPPAPTCIISDQCMPWTIAVSAELGIPRLIFHGPSCFFLLCTLIVANHREAAETSTDDLQLFPVPELPQRIEVCQTESRRFFDWPGWQDFLRRVEEAEEAADGVVLNTFQELEPWCIDLFRTAVGKPVWPIGPVSLFHKDGRGMAARGSGSTGSDEHSSVIRWLDGRLPGSVLFVSFGSVMRSPLRQVVEICGGLESSGWAFVWAIKEAGDSNSKVEEWLATSGSRRGLVIRGWVPQVLILSQHKSVGGLMTHCGWNSTLEAVAAGVPMATWPQFGDQFLNEKLVVEVLKTGVAVGGERKPVFYPMPDSDDDVVVGREEVERAVAAVMGGGEEGEKRRKRAGDFGEMARVAMEEGASSYTNLELMISHAIQLAKLKQ